MYNDIRAEVELRLYASWNSPDMSCVRGMSSLAWWPIYIEFGRFCLIYNFCHLSCVHLESKCKISSGPQLVVAWLLGEDGEIFIFWFLRGFLNWGRNWRNLFWDLGLTCKWGLHNVVCRWDKCVMMTNEIKPLILNYSSRQQVLTKTSVTW